MKIIPQSVQLIKSSGSDLDIVNAARVSFNKESPALDERDIKLINYLAKHNHFTPFCHNSITFRVKAPIFVCRQLSKHQIGGTINEVSRRYVDNEPEFFLPTILHGRPESVKQGTGNTHEKSDVILSGIKNVTRDSLSYYRWLINEGVAPEEARMILPLNTMTEWWWTGSLMFFARVCKQRLDAHAQNATREIACLIAGAIPSEFSHSWKALMGQSN